MAQCRNCGRAWRSLTEAHCARCHAHFTSGEDGFARHLVERGDSLIHLDPRVATDSSDELLFEPVDTVYGVSFRRSRVRSEPDGRHSIEAA